MKKVLTKTFRLTTFCVLSFCLRAATLERTLMLLKVSLLILLCLKTSISTQVGVLPETASLVLSMKIFYFFMGVVIVDLKAYCYLVCFNSFPKVFLIMKKGLDRFLSKCLASPDDLLIFEGRYCLEHLSGLGDF